MALGYQSMVNITADKLLRMMMFSLKFGESFGRFSISVRCRVIMLLQGWWFP
jgi:hypothetical protein